jgi:hypothetical protein
MKRGSNGKGEIQQEEDEKADAEQTSGYGAEDRRTHLARTPPAADAVVGAEPISCESAWTDPT